jgi:hypothetical protein
LPCLAISGRHLPLKIAVLAKQGSPHHLKFCTLVRNLHTAFNLLYVYDYITKLYRQQTEAIQNHENEHVHTIGQGEARHRKYNKRLKLGGGQSYDHPSD